MMPMKSDSIMQSYVIQLQKLFSNWDRHEMIIRQVDLSVGGGEFKVPGIPCGIYITQRRTFKPLMEDMSEEIHRDITALKRREEEFPIEAYAYLVQRYDEQKRILYYAKAVRLKQ